MDIQRKLQEDPLINLRKTEVETRKRILDNPLKMREIQAYIEKTSKKKKKKSKKKKKKHSGNKSDDSNDEDIDALLLKKLNKLKKAETATASDSDDSSISEKEPKQSVDRKQWEDSNRSDQCYNLTTKPVSSNWSRSAIFAPVRAT